MQSVPITTKVVSSNPGHDGVYSIQYYLIKIASDLRQIVGFLRFPAPIKLLLKVALNTMTPPFFNKKLYLIDLFSGVIKKIYNCTIYHLLLCKYLSTCVTVFIKLYITYCTYK